MYLSRLTLNHSRLALNWLANPYRIHQRLMAGCDNDPRMLFRVEEAEGVVRILVQSQQPPRWEAAFADFAALEHAPEVKEFEPNLSAGERYRFRLFSNPTVKRGGKRLGLVKVEEQRAWLERKLKAAGAEVLDCQISSYRLQKSEKSAAKDAKQQTHLVVQFDGDLRCAEPERLAEAVRDGIGSAKAYGCGLLSLARIG